MIMNWLSEVVYLVSKGLAAICALISLSIMHNNSTGAIVAILLAIFLDHWGCELAYTMFDEDDDKEK